MKLFDDTQEMEINPPEPHKCKLCENEIMEGNYCFECVLSKDLNAIL